jgi:hypothetical protein
MALNPKNSGYLTLLQGIVTTTRALGMKIISEKNNYSKILFRIISCT